MVRGPQTDPHAPRLHRTVRSRAAGLAVVLALTGGLVGCGGDDYCASVKDHQRELTDLTSSGSPSALLAALPVFRDLAAEAPDDVADDWQTFLDPLERLDDALRDAGLDPATYDRSTLPDALTDEQRTRIRDAGTALADPAVVQAFANVQQQAEDVCHAPLTL